MQGWRRRATYVCLFEITAVTISSVFFSYVSGAGASHSVGMSVMIACTAMTMNCLYNIAFEAWEARQLNRARTIVRRVFHAAGFQICLMLVVIPLMAWWLSTTMLNAFLMNLALIVFFPAYTFVFCWAFDAVFGPPLSAQQS